MSNPGDADATPITSLRQLADYIAAGCKPREQFRIGTEHEKFGFRLADLAPPPYEPADGQPARSATCWTGSQRFGGEPILDRGNTIGLKQGDAAISLEPAGQLELSGAPLDTLHETTAELEAHYDQVRACRATCGIGFAPLGFHPIATREADAVDAERPLRHHAPLHAEGRHARPRHDDAHLHRAGQPRLRVRSRTWCASCACRCCCSRWRPRCSPTRRSPRAGRTASCPTARMSGPTPTTHRSGIPR